MIDKIFHKSGWLGNNEVKCSIWGKKHRHNPYGGTDIVCDTLIIRSHISCKNETLINEGDVFILESKPWIRNIVQKIIEEKGELITIKFLNHAYLKGSLYHNPRYINDDDITTGLWVKFYPDYYVGFKKPEEINC